MAASTTTAQKHCPVLQPPPHSASKWGGVAPPTLPWTLGALETGAPAPHEDAGSLLPLRAPFGSRAPRAPFGSRRAEGPPTRGQGLTEAWASAAWGAA